MGSARGRRGRDHLNNGRFAVRRGRDGELLYELPRDAVTDKVVASNSHGPVLADLDGDGRLDAFFVVGHGTSREPDTNHGVAVCATGFRAAAPAGRCSATTPGTPATSTSPPPRPRGK